MDKLVPKNNMLLGNPSANCPVQKSFSMNLRRKVKLKKCLRWFLKGFSQLVLIPTPLHPNNGISIKQGGQEVSNWDWTTEVTRDNL